MDPMVAVNTLSVHAHACDVSLHKTHHLLVD